MILVRAAQTEVDAVVVALDRTVFIQAQVWCINW